MQDFTGGKNKFSEQIQQQHSRKTKLERVSRDITDCKKAEEAYRSLVDYSLQGLAIFQDGRVVFANKAMAGITGYTVDKMLAMSHQQVQAFVHPDDRELVWNRHRERLKGKSLPEQYELRGIRKDGSVCWLEIYARRIEYNEKPAIQAAYVDITHRKKTERLLQKERDKAQKYLDVARVMLVAIDSEQRVGLINKKGCEILGYSEDEILGKNWFDNFLPERVRGEVKAVFNRVINNEADGPEYYENPVLTKDGQERLIAWYNTILRDEKDKVIATLSSGEDITERKRAEESVRGSEERQNAMLQSISDHMSMLDRDYNILWANHTVKRIFGDDIIGKKCYKVYHGKAEPCDGGNCILVKAFRDEKVHEHDTQVIGKDGKEIYFHCTTNVALRDKDGRPTVAIEISRDITERKRAEQELLDYQAQLKSLASRLTLTEERERRRIAVELHDRVSQSLVISKIKLDGLRHSVSPEDPVKVIEEVCGSLGQAITDIRSLTFDLSSPILRELGFEAAVAAWLVDRIERKHGIATEFEDDGQAKPLDDDISAILFRDVRELLMNVVKHSRAAKVKVSIRRVGKQIRVDVEDDGVGFELSKTSSIPNGKGGFGLFSIRERLEQLGGHLDIESEPGRGCKVTMTAPLKQKSEDRPKNI